MKAIFDVLANIILLIHFVGSISLLNVFVLVKRSQYPVSFFGNGCTESYIGFLKIIKGVILQETFRFCKKLLLVNYEILDVLLNLLIFLTRMIFELYIKTFFDDNNVRQDQYSFL